MASYFHQWAPEAKDSRHFGRWYGLSMIPWLRLCLIFFIPRQVVKRRCHCRFIFFDDRIFLSRWRCWCGLKRDVHALIVVSTASSSSTYLFRDHQHGLHLFHRLRDDPLPYPWVDMYPDLGSVKDLSTALVVALCGWTITGSGALCTRVSWALGVFSSGIGG